MVPMKITLYSKPIPKARHMSRIQGNRIHTYDPQVFEKEYTKQYVKRKMLQNGLKSFQDEPISMILYNYVPMPKSWSIARKNAFEGKFCETRPDLDNYLKFYGDILNEVAYLDDSRIVSIFTEKRYSKDPRVEITLSNVGGSMVNEHALTVNGEITIDQLSYLIKKANSIGQNQRNIFRVYSQEDIEGKHIYFETESLTTVSEGMKCLSNAFGISQ
jgi:Holliday junction resolvase RusA-like endonuclease